MQDLIARVMTRLDISQDKAERAVGTVLALVREQGNKTEVEALFAHLPGAHELADRHARPSGGGFLARLGGAMGGPLGALAKLQAAGLNTEESKTLGREVLTYAKENAGEERVKAAAGTIPGLSGHV